MGEGGKSNQHPDKTTRPLAKTWPPIIIIMIIIVIPVNRFSAEIRNPCFCGALLPTHTPCALCCASENNNNTTDTDNNNNNNNSRTRR